MLIAFKGTVNGAFNALLATLLSGIVGLLPRARERLRLAPPELTHFVFALTLMAMLVSGAIPLIDTGAGIQNLEESHLSERLHDQARQLERALPNEGPVSPERLQTLLDRAGLSEWESAAFIGPGGRILAQAGRVASVRTDGSLSPVLSDMAIWMPRTEGSTVNRWIRGRYQVTRLISGVPGVSVLVIEHAAEPVVRAFRSERSDMIFFVADLFAIGLLIAWGTSRLITGPLVRLETAAATLNTKIARGEKPNLPKSSIAEYRSLTRTIEDMAGRLAESFQEVTAARADLERQVRERTVELGRFKSTLDQTRDCVFMFDADQFRFFYVNEGAILHIGHDRDALIGMNAHAIDPGTSRAGFERLVTPLIRGEQPWLLFETHHRHRQGRLIPVEVFLQYVRDDEAGTAAGTEGRFVAIVRDLSERRRVERMQSEFISTVSHELRTPVAALVGALKLLESGALKDKRAKADHLVRLANRNGERLHALVNDLLDLEKLTAGKMRFAFKVHALDTLITQAVESAQALGAERGITIEIESAIPDVRLLVDAGRFDQVLGNLLSNAVKFSPPEGRVVITARETVREADRMIRISVIDQGAGIPEAFHARIFEKFAQADSSNRRRTSGTGLGLAISRDIVERMGGAIDFETAEGAGSTFFFDLPVWGAPVEPPAAVVVPAEPAHGPVLLVAGESSRAARIAQELDAAGQETIWVPTAVDALAELLRNPDIRAMVLDIDMPDANWPDLLATFGERHTARATDLIPFAGDPERPDSLMLVPEPWLHWVADPPRPGDLDAILRRIPAADRTRSLRTLIVRDTPEMDTASRDRLRALGPVETATTIDAALAMLDAAAPPFDIVVIALSIGEGDALALLDRLRAAPPRVGCFLAVGKPDDPTIREIMRARLMTGGHGVADLIAAFSGDARTAGRDPDREPTQEDQREKGASI